MRSRIHWLIGLALLTLLFRIAVAAPFAYITNLGSNNVSVIDTARNAVVATIPVGLAPAGVVINSDCTRVYVANHASNSVSVIDTASSTVVATIAVGAGPSGVAINPAGTRIYVANENSNNVSVIEGATNVVIATVAVGPSPFGVAVNPAGTRAYVSNGDSNTVMIIDTATNQVIATAVVGTWPAGIAVGPDGTRIYVALRYTDSVAVMDAATNTVVHSTGVGRLPNGVAVNSDGTRVYVANTDSNSVSVVDTAAHGVIATVAVGTMPVGVGVTPSGDRIYVANLGSDTVSVVDTAGKRVIATIAVGTQPAALGESIGQAVASGPNYQGLWWKAPANSEPFWGINFAHQGDRVFGTWYTYDTSGKAWWLSMLASRSTGETYSGPIYVDTGPPFNNFVGAGVPTEVGSGTLSFTDANNGAFYYHFDAGTGGSPVAVIQTKVLARFDLGTGPQPACTFSETADLAAETNYQDLWWAASGAESGWGINFAHQGSSIFATWFTYDSSSAPLWLSALLQRQGASNVYSGPMTRTSGPCFNSYNPGDVVQPIPTVGTATVTFANGNAATFNYTTNGAGGLPAGVNQSKAIVRFPFGPGGTVCQ